MHHCSDRCRYLLWSSLIFCVLCHCDNIICANFICIHAACVTALSHTWLQCSDDRVLTLLTLLHSLFMINNKTILFLVTTPSDNQHHVPDIVVYHGTAMHLMQLLPVREPTCGLAAATPLQQAYARNIQEAAQVIKSVGECPWPNNPAKQSILPLTTSGHDDNNSSDHCKHV